MFGLLRSTVYLKLHADRLTVRHVESGRSLVEPPLVVNPLKHPRTLISDFTVAEALLKGVMRKLFAGSFFIPAPLGAGASKVIIWTGRELTDDEARNRVFPSEGKILAS